MRRHNIGLLFATLLVVLPATTRAQLGSGWTRYEPIGSFRQGTDYSNVGGIETFRIGPGDRRSEIEMRPKWTSGMHQFEGWVKIKTGSGGPGGSSVQQLMRNPDGDVAQLRIYVANGGTLKVLQGQQLATGFYERWGRINAIHDAATGRTDYYLDGVHRSTHMTPTGSTFYWKYGIYMRGEFNPESQWRDVKVFMGGSRPAGATPPPASPADAGAADGPAPDALVARDIASSASDGGSPAPDSGASGNGAADGSGDGSAGAGGAGGGGSGGASGSSGGAGGGSGGGGGSTGGGPRPRGTGGTSPPRPMDPGDDPSPAGCSCRTGNQAGGGPAAALLLLLLLLLRVVVRRRRTPC